MAVLDEANIERGEVAVITNAEETHSAERSLGGASIGCR
jgi:hypothetical protein